jgi:putative nucleotidyltransferase with HDIG domain
MELPSARILRRVYTDIAPLSWGVRLHVMLMPVLALFTIAVTVHFFPGVRPQIALPLPFLSPEMRMVAGVVFWTGLTFFAANNPVILPSGPRWSCYTAPQIAATVLGGPIVGIITVIGILDREELRGRVPWYGTLSNLSAGVITVAVAGVVCSSMPADASPLSRLAYVLIAFAVYHVIDAILVDTIVALKSGRPLLAVLRGSTTEIGTMYIALAPTGWLMMFLYTDAGAWATVFTVVPLLSIRLAVSRLEEMREGFISTIHALSAAIEARDSFTSGHSTRVSEVAGDIARAMNMSFEDIEKLEWAGILHDIGKIGVPDAVLLKPGRLTPEERSIIESHPVIGAMIVGPIRMLGPEIPTIRHHHERYDGKGYPDGLAGEQIPLTSRVMAVADSFDAMTSQRPYRMVPLTVEQAMTEIRSLAGAQFDPDVVAAFEKTKWAQGALDPRRFVGEEMNQADMSSAAGRIAAGYAFLGGQEPEIGGPTESVKYVHPHPHPHNG